MFLIMIQTEGHAAIAREHIQTERSICISGCRCDVECRDQRQQTIGSENVVSQSIFSVRVTWTIIIRIFQCVVYCDCHCDAFVLSLHLHRCLYIIMSHRYKLRCKNESTIICSQPNMPSSFPLSFLCVFYQRTFSRHHTLTISPLHFQFTIQSLCNPCKWNQTEQSNHP